MDPTLGILTALLKPLTSVAQDKWSQKEEYKLLQHLSHERISRELFWNIECIRRYRDDIENISYVDLIRTQAFDGLVESEIPLDYLFNHEVNPEFREVEPYSSAQFKNNIQGIANVSELVDRTYNRLWMLKHRKEKSLPLGDIDYLLNLTVFTFLHTTLVRRNSQKERQNPKSLIAGFSYLTKKILTKD